MATQRKKFLVGLFMSGGVLIALVATIWLGMNKYFEEGKFYSTYFDQSVQGLSVDSPVKYRGVSVGRVDQIAVAPDSRLIMVIMMIDSSVKIEKDMLAQIRVVGITGSMFIELDRGTEEELAKAPALTFSSKYPVIASKPSEISRLFRGLDEVIQQAGELDLKGISERSKNALDKINSSIDTMQLEALSTELRTTLANFNHQFDATRWQQLTGTIETSAELLNATLAQAQGSFSRANALLDSFQTVVDGNKDGIDTLIADFGALMENTNTLIHQLQELSGHTDENLVEANDRLGEILTNLSSASNTLDRTLKRIESYPGQLLFSTPPAPRTVEKQ
jgi:phospholipid/cholesterol/gamma-HCH transport system substrate-binding protein